MSMLFKRIKDWATSITSFRGGDVIPVDGPSGTAKMSKDNLLARTAENALVDNLSPKFDPTKPNDAGGYAYYAGTSVFHEGKNYVFVVNHKSGHWNFSEVEQKPLSSVVDFGSVGEAVNAWLDDHPEATTTVQDGSLTEEKFSGALKLQAIKDYVTPEMFGAVGDGVADDTEAFQAALNEGTKVLIKGKYKITNTLYITKRKTCIVGLTASNNLYLGDSCCLLFEGILSEGLVVQNSFIRLENFSMWVTTNTDSSVGTMLKLGDDSHNLCDIYAVNLNCYGVEDVGIYIKCYKSVFTNIRSYGKNYGFYIVGAANDIQNTSNVFSSCYAMNVSTSSEPSTIGWHIENLIYSTFNSCACDYCDVAYEISKVCIGLKFNACGCENVWKWAILIKADSISRAIDFDCFAAESLKSTVTELVRVNGLWYSGHLNLFCTTIGSANYLYVGNQISNFTFPKWWPSDKITLPNWANASREYNVISNPDNIPAADQVGLFYSKDGHMYMSGKFGSGNTISWKRITDNYIERMPEVSAGIRFVVPLCRYYEGAVNTLSCAFGRLIICRANGNAGYGFFADVYANRYYNQPSQAAFSLFGNYECTETVNLDGTEGNNDFQGYRLVKYTKGGITYIGLDCYTSPGCFPYFFGHREYTGRITYYNQSTHTTLDNDVKSTITKISSLRNEVTIDRAKKDADGNLIKAPANYPSTGTYTLKIIDGVVQWVADV